MLHSDLSPELPCEPPPPPQHNTHNIQLHARPRHSLPTQLQDSDTCSLSQINWLYFSPPEPIADLLTCPPQLSRLDGDTILLDPTHPLLLERRDTTRLGTDGTNPSPVQRFSVHCTSQRERPLMSHIHRFQRLLVSHESLIRKPWAEGEIPPADTALWAVI